MTRFTASNQSAATLKSARPKIWEALTDPTLLPKLTPYLQRIDVDGDRWTWQVTKVPVLGKNIGSTFTEVMSLDEQTRIRFTHDKEKTDEQTEVQGEYHLEDRSDGGTRVSIDIEVTVELPFPKAMRRPVEGAMKAVMGGMGRVFARNLLRHLGER
jgi:carbon monoxide dehydrogenase subunit G